MNLYTLDKVGKTGKCIHLLYICSLVGFYGLWSFVPYTAGGATNLAEFRETKYMLRILWWRIKWRRKSVKSQLFYKMHHGSKFEFILPPRFFSITHGNLLSLSLSLRYLCIDQFELPIYRAPWKFPRKSEKWLLCWKPKYGSDA